MMIIFWEISLFLIHIKANPTVDEKAMNSKYEAHSKSEEYVIALYSAFLYKLVNH